MKVLDGPEDTSLFGELLKRFRERRKLTQTSLAHKIGQQNRGSIQAWESSQYLPKDRETVLRLARTLQLAEGETDHRTTRQVTLTGDGTRLFERCRSVLAELELLQEEASGAREKPSGTLRIDMPVSLGRIVMLPLLARLMHDHPALIIDARFSDAYVDLVRDGIDVAIRTGNLTDSSLVARRLGTQELLLFAAPTYLKRFGRPRTLADLDRHVGVLFRVPSTGRDRPWNFRVRGRDVNFMPKSRIRADQGDALVQAAVQGMGIGQVPHYMLADELKTGALVELLPSLRPTPMPIWAVMPTSRLIPPRVRVLLDLMEGSPTAFPAALPSVLSGRRSASRRAFG